MANVNFATIGGQLDGFHRLLEEAKTTASMFLMLPSVRPLLLPELPTLAIMPGTKLATLQIRSYRNLLSSVERQDRTSRRQNLVLLGFKPLATPLEDVNTCLLSVFFPDVRVFFLYDPFLTMSIDSRIICMVASFSMSASKRRDERSTTGISGNEELLTNSKFGAESCN